jgi:hypothetical protein
MGYLTMSRRQSLAIPSHIGQTHPLTKRQNDSGKRVGSPENREGVKLLTHSHALERVAHPTFVTGDVSVKLLGRLCCLESRGSDTRFDQPWDQEPTHRSSSFTLASMSFDEIARLTTWSSCFGPIPIVAPQIDHVVSVGVDELSQNDTRWTLYDLAGRIAGLLGGNHALGHLLGFRTMVIDAILSCGKAQCLLDSWAGCL